jgi:hypothetical protein
VGEFLGIIRIGVEKIQVLITAKVNPQIRPITAKTPGLIGIPFACLMPSTA